MVDGNLSISLECKLSQHSISVHIVSAQALIAEAELGNSMGIPVTILAIPVPVMTRL